MTPEQQAEIRQLLAAMAVLSDAPGTSFILSGVNTGKKASSGTAGPGSRDGDQPLLDKWAPRFADPANDHRLPALILLARHDLERRTGRSPTPVGEQGEREDSWERDARIIDWYEDVDADRAAIMESSCGTYVSASNIRKVRRRNDRDPERGLPQVPREHIQRTARELRARGDDWSIRKIAREMNVSPSTVQRALAA